MPIVIVIDSSYGTGATGCWDQPIRVCYFHIAGNIAGQDLQCMQTALRAEPIGANVTEYVSCISLE